MWLQLWQRSRHEKAVQQHPPVFHHMAGIELTRWNTEEGSACVETINYQSAPMAERLINSKPVTQAWGKNNKSIDIDIIIIDIILGVNPPKVTPSASSESFFPSPILSHPPLAQETTPFNSPPPLHLADSLTALSASVLSNREDSWPSCRYLSPEDTTNSLSPFLLPVPRLRSSKLLFIW